MLCRHATTLLAIFLATQCALAQSERNLSISPAESHEQRFALVVGINGYKVAPLKNAVNDGRAMRQALASAGFEVTAMEDASLPALKQAVRNFSQKLTGGGVGLFYFAGQCASIAGKPYVMPVDALNSGNISATSIASGSIELQQILGEMGAARNKMNFVILDCCLHDPFNSGINPILPMLPPETHLAFGTTPGNLAADGAGEHGLYTEHLLAALAKPGLGVEQLFKQVRVGVSRAAKQQAIQQVPWESSTLSQEFYFRPPAEAGSQAAQAQNAKPGEIVDPALSSLRYGNYHALVIGIDNYRNIPKLQTATHDARAVAKLLQSAYGFSVKLLIDATRSQISDAFDELRKNLTEQDNLLIYYAGHGYLDTSSDRGYWLPADAEGNRRGNWLSNAALTDTVRAVRAKHVLVVADSCYAGTITRSVETSMSGLEDISRLARKKARIALMSGGLEPVEDAGGSGHSVFAKAFLETLNVNRGITDMSQVFSSMRRQVMLSAQQTPQYGDIRQTGHDGGDFIFVRKSP